MASRVTTKACTQRTARNSPIVPRLCRFFARSRVRNSALVRRWSKRSSAVADRGISKQGEPSSPTLARTGPSSGTMALVAIMQFSPVRPPAG